MVAYCDSKFNFGDKNGHIRTVKQVMKFTRTATVKAYDTVAYGNWLTGNHWVAPNLNKEGCKMASAGMKAKLKKELRAVGIREVRNAAGRLVKLQNAKISDLVSALPKK